MGFIVFIKAINVCCREWVVDTGILLQEVIVNGVGWTPLLNSPTAPLDSPKSTAPTAPGRSLLNFYKRHNNEISFKLWPTNLLL